MKHSSNNCLSISIPVLAAAQINKKSWLNDEEYKSFIAGYEYASTQTRAIKGLSKISPEEAYFVYEAIKRGVEMSKPNLPLYTVIKDGQIGPSHYAESEQQTLCDLEINQNWFILTNNHRGVAICPKCKEIFNNLSAG